MYKVNITNTDNNEHFATNENVQRAQVHLKDTDQLQLGERVLIDLSNPLCYMHFVLRQLPHCVRTMSC